MIIKEHMSTNVITASPGTPIMEARKEMKVHNVRRLPVMEGDKLVGIITEGDIQEAGPSDATSLNVWELNYLLGQITVKEVMTKEVLTVDPDETIEEAALIMRENKVAGHPEANIDEFVVRIEAPDIDKVIRALRDSRIEVTDLR